MDPPRRWQSATYAADARTKPVMDMSRAGQTFSDLRRPLAAATLRPYFVCFFSCGADSSVFVSLPSPVNTNSARSFPFTTLSS